MRWLEGGQVGNGDGRNPTDRLKPAAKAHSAFLLASRLSQFLQQDPIVLGANGDALWFSGFVIAVCYGRLPRLTNWKS
jgi:hypothetical protein